MTAHNTTQSQRALLRDSPHAGDNFEKGYGYIIFPEDFDFTDLPEDYDLSSNPLFPFQIELKEYFVEIFTVSQSANNEREFYFKFKN